MTCILPLNGRIWIVIACGGRTGLTASTDAIHLPNFPRLIFMTLQERGYSQNDLIGGLDVVPDQLSDETFRLSVQQHEAFVLRALDITGNPHLALEILQGGSTGTYSLSLMAIVNSGRVSRAIDLITRYNKIITRALDVQAESRDGRTAMVLTPNLKNPRVVYFALSSFILFLDNVFRDALGGAHLVQRAELAVTEPDGFGAVRDRFAFPVSFGHDRTRTWLDPTLLDAPLRQADAQTVRLLTEMCERQLAEAETGESFEARVTALLVERIPAPPKLDEAARALGISPRGLRRKLQQAGTTYQHLLDGIRLNMASELLTGTEETIAAIAYELGFDNASHFARAFRQWTGQSPTAFRRGHKQI